jgi:hypothetical protein
MLRKPQRSDHKSSRQSFGWSRCSCTGHGSFSDHCTYFAIIEEAGQRSGADARRTACRQSSKRRRPNESEEGSPGRDPNLGDIELHLKMPADKIRSSTPADPVREERAWTSNSPRNASSCLPTASESGIGDVSGVSRESGEHRDSDRGRTMSSSAEDLLTRHYHAAAARSDHPIRWDGRPSGPQPIPVLPRRRLSNPSRQPPHGKGAARRHQRMQVNVDVDPSVEPHGRHR